MNSVNLIGSVVEEPEVRVSPVGEAQCALRIAVPRVAGSGFREPGVVYVEVVASGLRARELADEVRHGMRIGVSGRLELDEWIEPDGERRARYEVMADQLEVLDPPPGAGVAPPGSR